ncbi:type II toxin-antitoxin system HicB family antitoxin [Granulicella sp. dw_53]|uniref:type II toxin-antitoxin system HicB family antitoxin n=1 Tax=Granulicella sp. dw_53 TaxID=2719792 RepID=UPI001BD29E1E|nr:type II toxin-antitoxin system HicB family antitoxin [Granulicella sp. dw_53]
MTYKVELVRFGEGYSVACPELPGCASQGETEEEAIENIKSAILDYLAATRDAHRTEPASTKVRYISVPELLPDNKSAPMTPFVVKPLRTGLPQNLNYDKVSLLLEEIEGPLHR